MHIVIRSLGVPFVCVLLMSLALTPHRAGAQTISPPLDPMTAGRLYYIAFPDTTTNRIDPRFPNNRVVPETSLWMYSAVDNSVTIDDAAGARTVLPLKAGEFKAYKPTLASIVPEINTVVHRATRVQAREPIVLYCYVAGKQYAEAWTPIPVEAWDTKHYAACVSGEIVRDLLSPDEIKLPHLPKPAPAEILVIAAYDSTTVTITFPAGLRPVGGTPRMMVILNAGDVYQVQSRVDTSIDAEMQDDIAAAEITSSRPVGVISGNTRAMFSADEVPLTGNAFKNMFMEWIPPTSQHGRKFAWLPTWDARRPGAGAPVERHREYVRVYNTTGEANLKGYELQPGGDTKVPIKVTKRDTLTELSVGISAAAYFETEKPAMLMMHSAAVVRKVSEVPTQFGVPAQTFEGWAPYMAEVTPREQWSSFAPFYAPSNPGGMESFINVVTDTVTARGLVREDGRPFPLTRRIPGTDLIWGTMSVTPGESHWVYARDGGTFGGTVYGLARGEEIYRPGAARRKDGGDRVTASAMHPAEYEEYSALSYGYPLAPRRSLARTADVLRLDTSRTACSVALHVEATNNNPAGLRSIMLGASSRNAVIANLTPAGGGLTGATSADADIAPIDPLKDMHAEVMVTDRTGATTTTTIDLTASIVVTAPADSILFGTVLPGITATRSVTVRNPLTRPVNVKKVRLARGVAPYTMRSLLPRTFPSSLAPADSITVTIDVTPTDTRSAYDTLVVELDCGAIRLPVEVGTSLPKPSVNRLEFGANRQFAQPIELPLAICNIGNAPLSFSNPNTSDPTKLITWSDTNFTIDTALIASLKSTTLVPGGCIQIPVRLRTDNIGTFRTHGVVWAAPPASPDSSVWIGVIHPTSSVSLDRSTGTALAVLGSGPGVVRFRYALAVPMDMRAEMFDARGVRVAVLADGHVAAGEGTLRWEVNEAPAGTYFCRLTAGGDVITVPCIVLR